MKTEYLETHFRCATTELPDDFWLITAFNPDGIDSTDELNWAADAELFAELEKLGHTPIRITGYSPDELHSEAGWSAPIDEDEALHLGRIFRQEALFHFLPARIDLINCRDASRIILGERMSRTLLKKAPK